MEYNCPLSTRSHREAKEAVLALPGRSGGPALLEINLSTYDSLFLYYHELIH